MSDAVPRVGGSILTTSGRRVYPLDPRAGDVDVPEIVHALSNICRFGGHLPVFYSVAQHSLHVMECVRETQRAQPSAPRDPVTDEVVDDLELLLAALLHDAPEAYLGDVVKPIKDGGAVTEAWLAAERRWSELIDAELKLGGKLAKLGLEIKSADESVYYAECRDLRSHRLPENVKPWSEHVYAWPPTVAASRFLRAFYELEEKRGRAW